MICGHGATVGELDEDQIFYLTSRGISKQKAKVILIDAFLNEMISLSISEKFHNVISVSYTHLTLPTIFRV